MSTAYTRAALDALKVQDSVVHLINEDISRRWCTYLNAKEQSLTAPNCIWNLSKTDSGELGKDVLVQFESQSVTAKLVLKRWKLTLSELRNSRRIFIWY